MNHNLHGNLFFMAGILFIITAMIKKDLLSVPLGCCFIALGFSRKTKKK